MVQAVINIDEKVNRVLNIVKAKYGLKDKSQAINLVVNEYENTFLEPQLRPEYVKKLKSLDKEKGTPFKNMTDLRKIIEK